MPVRRVQIADETGANADLHVDVTDDTAVGELDMHLTSRGHGAQPRTVGLRRLDETGLVGELELEHGAIIGVGHHAGRAAQPATGLRLIVVAGPDSGQSLVMIPGRPVTIGRGGATSLMVGDPLMSVAHAEITMIDDRKGVVRDLASTNGTELEGTSIDGAAEFLVGQQLHVGSSVLTVENIQPEDLAVLERPIEGERAFPRQFRPARSPHPTTIEAPRPPREPEDATGGMWLRALLPMVTGVGFALITGRIVFLLIVVVSPIVMLVEHWRRRRRAAERRTTEHARYEGELDAFRREVALVRRLELSDRRDAARCGGTAIAWADLRHRRLWERSPGDDDFGHVTVGLARQASPVRADDPDVDGDVAWSTGSPVVHDLVGTGPLAVVGPGQRARAATRGMVMNLAATHSPADLRIWILTDDAEGEHWGFARWLPHTWQSESSSTIAADRTDRARAIRHLESVRDGRRGDRSHDRNRPVHLVIIDGRHSIDAGDLVGLFEQPDTAVSAIIVDDELAIEGAAGVARIGPQADRSSVASKAQPLVSDVVLPEMTQEVTERAARAMAPLRPTAATDVVGLTGTVHLVDLEPTVRLEADRLRSRWATDGPVTDVVIGATADGPMTVDIVRDGPHGLIGGTSGSGKTELLKTLFVSLCARNHPDDLSIVVVDFKGGVDHEAIRPLPHVVDVATNLDIDQFKRTIELLSAEQMRRQELLGRVGAANITAYRAARRDDPTLPALPRLVVVVDEFGELLDDPDGKDQLKRLESITRIGRALGLHLLLVTQSFESNLPPQIEANAGLRMSLRVQKPGHSRVVLDDDAAASIPDHRVGRGLARFHGRALTEFQTARVAGRRRDLASDSDAITSRCVPFARLGAAVADAPVDDVPAHETDMHDIIGRITDAAAQSGWTEPAVPWPSPLPDRLELVTLSNDDADPRRITVGVGDHPQAQTREPTVIEPGAERLAVIGGADADVAGVLSTIVVAHTLAFGADDLHVYGIDLSGTGLVGLDRLPHCGALVQRGDHLSVRILRWLADEAARRRSMLARSACSTIEEYESAGNTAPPRILLAVNGAERLIGSETPHPTVLGPLLRLLSDATGVGIHIALGGTQRIAAHKLAADITRRLVMRVGDRGDASALGIPREFSTDLRVPRRCFDSATGRLTQIAHIGDRSLPESRSIARLADAMPGPTDRPPTPFTELTWPLPFDQRSLAATTPPPTFTVPLPVGVDTRSGEWHWLDLDEDGPMIAVVGGARSGRSSTLAFLARRITATERPVVNIVTSRRSPLAHAEIPGLRSHRIGQASDLESVLRHGPAPVVLIDDLHRLDDATPIVPLLERAAAVVATGPPELFQSRLGVLRALPQVGAGILLAPQNSMDANAFGVRRLDDEALANPRAGTGLVAAMGETTPIQIPWLDLGT